MSDGTNEPNYDESYTFRAGSFLVDEGLRSLWRPT